MHLHPQALAHAHTPYPHAYQHQQQQQHQEQQQQSQLRQQQSYATQSFRTNKRSRLMSLGFLDASADSGGSHNPGLHDGQDGHMADTSYEGPSNEASGVTPSPSSGPPSIAGSRWRETDHGGEAAAMSAFDAASTASSRVSGAIPPAGSMDRGDMGDDHTYGNAP
ncbi:hypothetical protein CAUPRSCDRAFT_11696 [Caulochytrium protostelioides]|nr:hypothetical protein CAUPRSCDRAFT_11696 [Caulochytrium protostelioides]